MNEYDLVFLGFPIESYGCPKEMHEFLGKYTENASLVFFITHGVQENNSLLPGWIDNVKKLLHPSAKVVDQFTCQSEVAQYVVDSLKQSGKPMLIEWANHCHLLKGLPDKNKLQKAKEFAKEVQQKFE